MVRRVALNLGLVDRPGGRKIHKSPVPRVGGIALYFGGLIGALPFLSDNHETVGLLLAATFVMLIGLLDDLIDLQARIKLAGQIIGCLILLAAGVKIDFVTDFIAGKGLVALGLLTWPLTLLWVIGLTNTVNLVDGVDGLVVHPRRRFRRVDDRLRLRCRVDDLAVVRRRCHCPRAPRSGGWTGTGSAGDGRRAGEHESGGVHRRRHDVTAVV